MHTLVPLGWKCVPEKVPEIRFSNMELSVSTVTKAKAKTPVNTGVCGCLVMVGNIPFRASLSAEKEVRNDFLFLF